MKEYRENPLGGGGTDQDTGILPNELTFPLTNNYLAGGGSEASPASLNPATKCYSKKPKHSAKAYYNKWK